MKGRVLLPLLVVALLATAQTKPSPQPEHKHLAPGDIKTQTADFLPPCTKMAAVRGDPAKEGATIYAQADSKCVIPWHWHTPTEELIIVSGRARLEMKDGSSEIAMEGSYLRLPARTVHQFTCEQKCTFYVVSGGPFDIHYVDQQGNEIQLEQALKLKEKPGK